MPLPPLRRLFFLTLVLTLLLGGCTQPSVWPVPSTQSTTSRTTSSPDLAELADLLAAEYGLNQDQGRLVSAQQISGVNKEPLFVAHSHGFPPNDTSFRQKVSIHAATADGWTELGRVDLECAEHLNESSLEQVTIEPANVWLKVEGGVGAHSGCLELLRWDGEELTVVIRGFSSSPDAGSLVDLNGDEKLDLLLNNSDPYIFCYACGVRQYWAQLYYWDGQTLMEVTPAPLDDDSPSDLRALNDRAAELAAANLFADALDQIEQAEAIAPENAIVAWNAIWIRHHLEANRQEASASPYPLLNHVFAGDWEVAFDSLWEVGLSTLASSEPIPSESAAAGFEHVVGLLLAQCSDTALALQPERAAAHALGAWGRFLIDPSNPAVQAGLQRAAELAPEDRRYAELADAFEGGIDIAPVAETAGPQPREQTLADLLATEYDMVQDPSRSVAVQQLDTEDGPAQYLAFTYGLPPQTSSAKHTVSIHEAQAGGWIELDRTELDCVNYLDEFSLEQVSMETGALWLTVQGGAGAHGGCLELLRWDGIDLSLIISSFNSIPDMGSVTDLNGDGQVDLLLNNSDPYIFCYACGLQLYMARFFQWDGQDLVEAAPRSLPDDQPAELRAWNSRALALAEAGLYADALIEIEQAEILSPSNETVRWNAVWIRHHLDVSRQLALASPFPLLSHVFAGEWEASFDALWLMGPEGLFGDEPIPAGSAAFGYEHMVGELLNQYGHHALTLQPDRAAILAVDAWGHFLHDRDDPAVLSKLLKAAELAPEDSRFAELAAAFAERQKEN